MTEAQIAAAKRALSQAKAGRFHTMPESRDEWLAQIDAVAAETGIPNAYRLFPFAGLRDRPASDA